MTIVNCPGCDVEMPELEEGAEEPVRVCAECGGLTCELADLRPILLHHNLPGFEALGGRLVRGEEVGECPTCLVDLALMEGGTPDDPCFYEVCEECGRIFIGGEFVDPSLAPERKVVAFFQRFAAKKIRPGP